MDDSIEVRLRGALVGSPFRTIGRACDLAWLGFGDNRCVTTWRGEVREVYEHALHLQCPFRLDDASGTILGAHDMYSPATDPLAGDAEFDWDRQGVNLFDAQAQMICARLNSDVKTLVEEVHVDRYGGLQVLMSGGLTLSAFPATSFRQEYWRYFRPYRNDEAHLVVFDEEEDQRPDSRDGANG
ncbi:hypothetical protein ABZW96_36555 [Nocardia sp. NPDC004168]|uniref:hypothetical protein n=1 Tax=Nocardia sp. NPDC004168 TaxID=3154452 RepID=UPI0033A354C9